MSSLELPPPNDTPIQVDGHADEASWAGAVLIPELVTWEPSNEVPPIGPTVIRLLSDEHALYVYVEATDPEPRKIWAGLGRRDTRPDDTVAILVDPADDGRRGYAFACNLLGVQFDGLSLPESFDIDDSWDARWSCAGRRTATGYTLEYAIPWKALRLGGHVDSIGLLVQRVLPRLGQSYTWPRLAPGAEALRGLGHVGHVPELPRTAGLELLPELTFSWPASPSGRLQVAGLSPGLTARFSTPGFGVVGTFNPDFSQLESDEAQIDVNERYALFYEEKRPFFLEGQDWFDHPIDNLVYTRTINTPLYGARTNWTAGAFGGAFLHALDVAPPPTLTEGGGWSSDDLAGHQALATLLRLRVGLGHDGSIGFLGSDRTVVGTDLTNRVLGLDGRLTFGESGSVEAAAVGSATTSAGGGPSLGHNARVNVQWSGEALWARLKLESIGADFRMENGYVPQADLHGGVAEAHYNLYPTSNTVGQIALEPLDFSGYVYTSGEARSAAWDPSAWADFGNGAFAKVDVRVAGEDFQGLWIPYENLEVYAFTPVGRWLRAEAGSEFGRAPYYSLDEGASPTLEQNRGPAQEAWADVEFQPISALSFGVSPQLAHLATSDGVERYLAWTGRAKVEVYFSRAWWLRTIWEESWEILADERAWRGETVGAWEPSPGRALYLGGGVGGSREADLRGPLAWTVFAKASWAFEL